MKTLLGLLMIVAASSAQAGKVDSLRKLTCENEKFKVEVEATHVAGDRIGLIEWNVSSKGNFVNGYMPPLDFQDRSLTSFGGSTLGSTIWIKGVEARLTLMDDVQLLKCK